MNRRLVLLSLCVLMVLSLAACGGSAGPVTIQSVKLARDNGGEPGETVTSFRPDDHIFHAVVELNRIETGLKVRLAWIAVNAGGQQGFEIDSAEFTGLAVNTIHGQIELPNDWPAGSYKLDIYLNDTLARSVEFTVQ